MLQQLLKSLCSMSLHTHMLVVVVAGCIHNCLDTSWRNLLLAVVSVQAIDLLFDINPNQCEYSTKCRRISQDHLQLCINQSMGVTSFHYSHDELFVAYKEVFDV